MFSIYFHKTFLYNVTAFPTDNFAIILTFVYLTILHQRVLFKNTKMNMCLRFPLIDFHFYCFVEWGYVLYNVLSIIQILISTNNNNHWFDFVFVVAVIETVVTY